MKIVITGDTHSGFSDQTPQILEAFWKRVAEEHPVWILHAGDWATSHPRETAEGMHQAARICLESTIITVTGNHDYWNDERPTNAIESHIGFREHCEMAHIRHIPPQLSIDAALPARGLTIVGGHAWYNHPNPPTKDRMYMNAYTDGMDTFEWLRRGWQNQFLHVQQFVHDNSSNYKIFLTHFPGGEPWGQDPHMMEMMAEECDLIVRGHSHKAEDFMWGKCRVVNAGSDYDDPKYLVVEV